MHLLAIDSSTSAGSVALLDDDKIIAQSILNLEQTQSQRLMPQIITLLENSNYEIEQLSGLGVGVGPGSFTGIRIGVSTACGLAQALSIPIAGVSTLESMAYNLSHTNGYICPIIKSNRNYVFAALFSGVDKGLKREFADSLITVDNLIKELKLIKEPIYFVGDLKKYQSDLEAELNDCSLVGGEFSFPNPIAIARLAQEKIAQGNNKSLYEITPNYLKRPQAEIDWAK